MNESVLIGRAEKFLAQIKQLNLKIPDDTPKFMELYFHLQDNIETLYDFRDNMELKGYKAPYRSLNKYGRPQSVEMKVDDMHDVSRHTQFFRMRAAAKKNILDRVKSSIASHKIALGHLEEYAYLTCPSCQISYRSHELSNIREHGCKCGSSDFQMTINPNGIYRLEILEYLPLSGDYMVKMSELSPLGREAFRSMVRIMKQEKRGIVKTLSLVIKALEDGRWVRKRVNIDAQDQMNYEKKIRETYGTNARIEFMQFHRKKPAIINEKQVQTALALGYVRHSEKLMAPLLPQLLEENLKNAKNLQIYEESLKKAKKLAKKNTEEWDDEKNIVDHLLSNLLHEKGLLDSNGKLDHSLQEDIQKRDKLQKGVLIKIPQVLLLWDFLRYYLSTSYDRRSKHSGPFPYLRPSLDTNQLKAFQEFPQRAVTILRELLPETLEYIPHLENVISFNFIMEKKTQGLHIKMDPAMGAAILNIKGEVEIGRASKIFKVEVKDAIKQKSNLETFQKPSTPKAQKFLKMVQG
ncbi:MAG TPA: DUF530 domain-containing protein [Methanobacteriaceae archaeon]|nr:DUF530 domain-containing protein [Methanobacteriaceae archaeon]